MSSAHQMKRLSHIQGLRGVAVAVVVLFHAGVPIHGGYLGVDMFFVISGYVISRMLYSEYQENKTIKLANFFQRRIMRLAPASSIVVIFSLAAGYLFLSIESLKISSWTALGNVFSIANYPIYYFTKDYFSATAESNIFLHYWSLAVEEQFYVFSAILVLILRKKTTIKITNFRKIFLYFILGVSFLFFILSFLPLPGLSKILNFYSPLPRIWEFGVGIVVLILEKRKPVARDRSQKWVFLIYLPLIFVLAFGKSEPSYRVPATVLAVMCTAVLIRFASEDRKIHRIILVNPIIRFIGDLSYSLYLWHWPILALANKVLPKKSEYILVILIVIFTAAVTSFFLLEKFFRRRYDSKFMFYVSLSLPIAALIFSSLILIQFRGSQINSMEALNRPGVYIGDTGHGDFHEFIKNNNYPCLPLSIRSNATNEGLLRCWQSKSGSNQDIAIIGDSHSEHLFPGISKAFPDMNVVYFDTLGLPIFGLDQSDRILKYVSNSQTIKLVIFSAYWSARGAPQEKLGVSIDYISRSGKEVLITDDVPTYSMDPYYCKFPPFGNARDSLCEEPKFFSSRDFNDYKDDLQKIVSSRKGVLFVSTFNDFCGSRTCSMVKDGILLFRDSNHLNLEGSWFVASQIKQALQENSLP